jgi:hypothetical protein
LLCDIGAATGLTEAQLEQLGKLGHRVMKCSRRDLAYAVAMKKPGATTVATTMMVAHMVHTPFEHHPSCHPMLRPIALHVLDWIPHLCQCICLIDCRPEFRSL